MKENDYAVFLTNCICTLDIIKTMVLDVDLFATGCLIVMYEVA